MPSRPTRTPPPYRPPWRGLDVPDRTPEQGRRVLSRALGIVLGTALVVGLAVACTARQSGVDNASGSGRGSSARLSPSRTIAAVPPSMRGQLVTRTIPGSSSGFPARLAYVYLPPVLRRSPHSRLPVLMLLHGTPGGPGDWVQKGGLARTMDAFAAAHGGRAPLVVMPDINGGQAADTECVDGLAGNAETYLTRDVPDYLRAHLPVAPPGRRWAVAGLSEGATCSLMLGLRHSHLFSTGGFFSGLARPTVGRTDNPAATIAQLFGGSRSSYEHHDPLWLMRHGAYPSLAMWLECGTRDRRSGAVLAGVAAAARGAGISTVVRLTPGGHQWSVWSASLDQIMPWLWRRIGP